MKRLEIKNNENPNFIGNWNIENNELCNQIIDFFENNSDLHIKGATAGGVDESIKKSTDINFTTSHLTKMMEEAVLKHPPKIINGRRIKLRYMHLGTTDPIRLIIHGNQTKSIPSSYKKYLSKALGKSLNLLATPVLIEFKNSDNPFKGKKNILSKRQINKRRRLIKYNKK